MTLRQFLIEQGVPEDEMDTWASDLMVLHTPQRERLIAAYNQRYHMNYRPRIKQSNVKGQDWYGKLFLDIPFGYAEYYKLKTNHRL